MNAIAVSRGTLVVAVVAVLAVAGAAVGFLAVRGDDPVIQVQTSTYTEAVAGSWQRVNPLYTAENDVDADLSRLIFSGLVRLGPDGSVQPDLAVALPEVSDGGRRYTFTLRDDLHWHDGVAVTSGDVSFTIAQIQDAAFAGSPDLAAAWQGITVSTPDASTVIFQLPEPYGPFLARHATLGILPRHLLVADGPDALHDHPFNAQPVGTGPFRAVSLASQEARLEAYRGYHFGRPSIDTFLIRFFTDYATAIRAVETGEVDGLFVRDGAAGTHFLRLREASGFNVETPSRASYLTLYLNNSPGGFFSDSRVRQAVSLALDREAIAETVFAGMAVPSASIVAPGSWPYTEDGDRFGQDRERAAELLREAGWIPGPATGVLTREGVEFRVTIRTDNDPTRRALADEVAGQLEPLGIRATVASTTFAVLRRDFLEERRYDAAIAGWDQGPDPDPYSAWHSSQAGPGGRNIADYAGVVADTLIAQGRTSTDPAIRADAYWQLQDIWLDETPSVVIAYPTSLYARRTSVSHGDLGVLFTPADRFHDVHEWKK